jgi:hypothetical protein
MDGTSITPTGKLTQQEVKLYLTNVMFVAVGVGVNVGVGVGLGFTPQSASTLQPDVLTIISLSIDG